MNKSCQHEPARMSVFTNRLGGLQEMFDLRQVGIGVAVVHQRIQKLRSLPDALLTSIQSEVLLLLRHHIIKCLILVVEPIELSNSRIGLRVVLPKLLFALPFLVAPCQEIIPFFHVFQRSIRCNDIRSHKGLPPRRGPAVSGFTLPLTIKGSAY